MFGSFGWSSRTPAPSELSCADPEDPCRLPNAFVADPPLDQVVARTWEAGARGRTGKVAWSGGVFRTLNRDDILFVSSGALTNEGHFENIDETLRQGIEASVAGPIGSSFRWLATYSTLEAEFRTPLTLSSPNHPAEEDGEIEIEPGDRLPGIPQHNFKAGLAATIQGLTVGGTLLSTSSLYLRGDEANLLPAIDGYSTVNVAANYAIARNVSLTARVTNLFGSDYATFGLLGEPDEVLGDDFEDPRFLSPGAPRAAWIGLEFAFR